MTATINDFSSFIGDLKDGMQDSTEIALTITGQDSNDSTALIYGIDLNTIKWTDNMLTINNPTRFHSVNFCFDSIEHINTTSDISDFTEQTLEWQFSNKSMTATLVFEIGG